ncbi:MAG TPA: hypothetical protein VFV30_08495 [Novosphingobium sp.]|nr:hypothetical protein [Novosphingobium sp.]
MQAKRHTLRWSLAAVLGCLAMPGGQTAVFAQSEAEAKQLRAQCDAGDPDACLNLQALKDNAALAEACAKGFANGCYNLGVRYRIGDGPLQPDLARAADLFDKACQLGHAYGCNDLGTLYLQGAGVTKSKAKAADCFRKALAIDPGHAAARKNLAAAEAK